MEDEKKTSSVEEKWRWQVKRPKQTEQNKYLLDHEEWTDCTFIVKNQTVNAHRLILSKGSPVFAAMLITSPLVTPGDIVINDQCPEAFSKLVRFIYTEELDTDDDNALQKMHDLLTLADYYDVPALFEVCTVKLGEKLCPGNACLVYELAAQMDRKLLKQKAWKIIIEKTDEVIKNENFLNASRSTVLGMTSQAKLNVGSEICLIEACLLWAKCRANNSDGQREALGPVISNLRFLSLTAKEFVQCPAKCDVLTDQEKLALLIKIIDPTDETPLNEEFSQNRKKRIAKSDHDRPIIIYPSR